MLHKKSWKNLFMALSKLIFIYDIGIFNEVWQTPYYEYFEM